MQWANAGNVVSNELTVKSNSQTWQDLTPNLVREIHVAAKRTNARAGANAFKAFVELRKLLKRVGFCVERLIISGLDARVDGEERDVIVAALEALAVPAQPDPTPPTSPQARALADRLARSARDLSGSKRQRASAADTISKELTALGLDWQKVVSDGLLAGLARQASQGVAAAPRQTGLDFDGEQPVRDHKAIIKRLLDTAPNAWDDREVAILESLYGFKVLSQRQWQVVDDKEQRLARIMARYPERFADV